MNDVWIITQTTHFADGSSREFIHAVYKNEDKARQSLSRKVVRRSVRQRLGLPQVTKSEYALNRWMVH